MYNSLIAHQLVCATRQSSSPQSTSSNMPGPDCLRHVVAPAIAWRSKKKMPDAPAGHDDDACQRKHIPLVRYKKWETTLKHKKKGAHTGKLFPGPSISLATTFHLSHILDCAALAKVGNNRSLTKGRFKLELTLCCGPSPSPK
jgi:hypothetical protein